MKKCELCKVPARIFCESDQATLCWGCDKNVHSANFLVARHSRTLLCRGCHSPTPWKATGAALGSALSTCDRCAGTNSGEEEEEVVEGDNDDETETVDEVGENQVVLWSPSSPPMPAVSSSVGGEESVDGDGEVSETATTMTSLKRQRETEEDSWVDRDSQEGTKRYGGEWRDEVACDGEMENRS